MTKTRILVAGAALALTLGLGAGVVAAQTDPSAPNQTPPAGSMHSGDMAAMHAQMPDDMQAQCETMHANGGMNSTTMGNGMMSGGMGS